MDLVAFVLTVPLVILTILELYTVCVAVFNLRPETVKIVINR